MQSAVINAATPLLQGLFGLVDDLFTTDEERSNAKLKLLELQSKGQLAQLAVNAQEAQSKSLFVAGWRPFIGWVCGLSFMWVFLMVPVINTLAFYVAYALDTDIDLSGLPVLDLSVMMPVLLGMLGLGALRTGEKLRGVHSDRMT